MVCTLRTFLYPVSQITVAGALCSQVFLTVFTIMANLTHLLSVQICRPDMWYVSSPSSSGSDLVAPSLYQTKRTAVLSPNKGRYSVEMLML